MQISGWISSLSDSPWGLWNRRLATFPPVTCVAPGYRSDLPSDPSVTLCLVFRACRVHIRALKTASLHLTHTQAIAACRKPEQMIRKYKNLILAGQTKYLPPCSLQWPQMYLSFSLNIKHFSSPVPAETSVCGRYGSWRLLGESEPLLCAQGREQAWGRWGRMERWVQPKTSPIN